MTDLDPCLLDCDKALTQADLLIAILALNPDWPGDDAGALRERIARLRREVDRLRGMATVAPRPNSPPEWIEFRPQSAWPEQPGESAAGA